MREQFERDLADGKAVELMFAKLLYRLQRHKKVQRTVGVFKGFDLIGDEKTTYEVKHDRRAKETGNFAFEFEDRGNPSGIEATTAEFWVQFDDSFFYIFDVRQLRDWLLMQKSHNVIMERKSKECSRSYIVPTEALIGLSFCEMREKEPF